MVFKSIIGAVCACLAVVSFSADSALVGRLAATPGGTDYQAYYDTEANLTWLADANAGVRSSFDDGILTADGRMTWLSANAWAESLDVAGITGWRLPDTIDVGNDGITPINVFPYTFLYQGVDHGYNITTHSELSNMFYNVLGNLAFYDINGNSQSGYGLINTGPFSNLQSSGYWSATEYVLLDYMAWSFKMINGFQGTETKGSGLTPWAVHDGDVGASVVPIPSAVWLFGSGLIGLIGIARRKKV